MSTGLLAAIGYFLVFGLALVFGFLNLRAEEPAERAKWSRRTSDVLAVGIVGLFLYWLLR